MATVSPEAFSLLTTSADRLRPPAKDAISSPSLRLRAVKSNSRDPSPKLARRAHLSRSAQQDKPTKRRARSHGLLNGFYRRTWALPLTLMLGFTLLYAINPTESNIIHHFPFLSYRLNDHTHQYGKGPWDLAFVCFYTIVLTFTREFIGHEILRPLARRGGIKSRGKQARFMEQMYTACYIAAMGPLGLYTMKRTPGLWYFATRGMYEAYPHTAHTAVFKFYYLFQAAFWVQQVIVMVLGQEKPRKDFRELIAHHVITVTLIYLSYRYHFTYIGLAVYVTHDISDFFLAISKSLNYLNHPAQASSFALCIAAWIYLRHYINLRILYSIATEYSTVGPFGLDWDREEYKCRVAQAGTFVLLAALQGLNLFWLYCLFRSAYRFVVLGVAKDDRSEVEESEVEVDGVVVERGKKRGGGKCVVVVAGERR